MRFSLAAAAFNWLARLLLILLILPAAGCRPDPLPPPGITPTPPATTLYIGLATGSAGLADSLTTAYAAHTDRAALQFITANTANLFADLAAGQLDAIIVHEIVAENNYWFNPVALDGLVLVVHPDNELRDISSTQVQAVYNGRVTNWRDLGGADRPIILVSRERGSGTRDIFRRRLMVEQRVSINALIRPDQQAVLETVAVTPGAIGYAMAGYLSEGVLSISLDGYVAAPGTLADQSYPLTVPLYFVNGEAAEPEGELRAFLAWLQSAAGQTLLGENYGRVR